MSGAVGAGLRHAVWPAGAVVIAATVAMSAGNRFTTYGGAGPGVRAATAAAAAALLGAAALTWRAGTRGAAPALAVAGVLWSVPEWVGWSDGPAWARALAAASSGAVLAAATLAVAALAGVSARRWRLVAALAVGGALLVALARILLVDPFLDPRCARLCGHNPLVVVESAAPGRVVVWLGTSALAVGAAVAVASALGGRRRGLAVAGACLVGGLAVTGAARLAVTEDPGLPVFALGFGASILGAVLLAAGLAIGRLREWRRRVALYRVVDELRAATPGSLDGTLARVLGDPALRLWYWSPARDGYVDAAGRPVIAEATGPRAVTSIRRHGHPVAALEHDAAIDGATIERVIGPAVRLSLENEQLRAATLGELAELRASRARIVERSDAERGRLERNLHDGAQQRVVGLALLLRALRTRTAPPPGGAAEARLDRAAGLVAGVLDELRTIARGIYPAVLADGGLRAAMPDLAESSTDVAVRIVSLPAGRQPPGVEAAAYLVVAQALVEARRRAATTLSIAAERRNGTLVVDLVDDAPPGGERHPLGDLDDRVGALDGRLVVAAGAAGRRVRLELPCGS
jgi:signal transduction histidine kinase